MENPQKTKPKSTLWPNYTVPWLRPKDSTVYFTDPCSAMLTAALITKVKIKCHTGNQEITRSASLTGKFNKISR